LDADGNLLAVAGVPPDYFSETGQLWGNPLYDWAKMEKDGYDWWVRRMQAILALVDVVRLDHFRGFMGYWSVPATAPTAQSGKWIKAPGAEIFRAMEKRLGSLPIIAEDLGEITTDVHEARQELGYPGMVILQFAWGAAATQPFIANPNSNFAPHRHEVNSVVYTGTHDNDTTVGWWHDSSTLTERTMMQLYLATDGNAPHIDLTRAALASVANTAVIPAQDILGLGGWARINYPGRADGNWCWRLNHGELNPENSTRLANGLLLFERHNDPPAAALPDPPKHPTY
jgi:4-alpha-glucanotransferase